MVSIDNFMHSVLHILKVAPSQGVTVRSNDSRTSNKSRHISKVPRKTSTSKQGNQSSQKITEIFTCSKTAIEILKCRKKQEKYLYLARTN